MNNRQRAAQLVTRLCESFLQKDVAEKLGIHQSYISHIMRHSSGIESCSDGVINKILAWEDAK